MSLALVRSCCSHTCNAARSFRAPVLFCAGLVVNDWSAFCGLDTTSTELAVVESIFNLQDKDSSSIVSEIQTSLIDTLAS
jgi:translation initiation factor 6